MEAIMPSHQEARGPSLMDEHQATKQQEQGNQKDWQWNRNQDLDAGRKVDKDALEMVWVVRRVDSKQSFKEAYTRSDKTCAQVLINKSSRRVMRTRFC
jgi:hypothetical protein